MFALRTGILREDRSHELGYGSGVADSIRLKTWQACGVWHRLHNVLLGVLRDAARLELSWASGKSASMSSPRRVCTGPNPTARDKFGSRRHPIAERNGVPLTFYVS